MCLGERSRRRYTDHVNVDNETLLVKVIKAFDHELDSTVSMTYRCHGVMTSHTTSCHASLVVKDVNDESPHIMFSNGTTANYDRLQPIEITGQVGLLPCYTSDSGCLSVLTVLVWAAATRDYGLCFVKITHTASRVIQFCMLQCC